MLRLHVTGKSLSIGIVEHTSPLYWSCAVLARKIYRDNYSARITPRPTRFVVCQRSDGELLACAGLTTRSSTHQRLFSEVYLEQPLDVLIAHRFGRALPLNAIAEVNALATLEPSIGQELVRVIPPLAWFLGHQALLCTATRRLQQIFARQNLPFEVLATADQARISGAPGVYWGTYYDTAPATGVIRLDQIGRLFDAHCGRYAFASQFDDAATQSASARQMGVAA